MTDIPSTGSTLRERNAAPIYGALLGVFVFQNLFNAFSPYLTLAINITVLLFVLIRHQSLYIVSAQVVIVGVFTVLVWMLLITIYRGDAETQIVLKYFRVTLNVSLFALIFGSRGITASSLVKAINFALGFHVFLVMLQIALPDITNMTAPVFGFEREMTILDQYTMRKLGASSSYDTASLLSEAALLFFYLQFTQGKGFAYLLLTTVALVATFMSSRTGIVLSLLIVIFLSIRTILRARRFVWKLVATLCFSGLMVTAYIQFYPIFLHTLGIAELQSGDASFMIAAGDYGTTGSFDTLTGEYLDPLDQPLLDLLIGFALDPNTIGKYTDIGYVKLIYHVGIVGTLVILFVHLYMLVVTRTFMQTSAQYIDRALIARFLFVLIAISFVFNYKSLELHSRGIGDFIYMLFFFLASWRDPSGRSGNPSHTGARSHL